MSYDPEQDPRYIPDPMTQIAREFTAAAHAETLEGLQQAIDRFDALFAMFETEGWAILVGILAKESDSLDDSLVRELDQAQWMWVRGQKLMADFVLAFPGRLSEQRRLANEMIRDLTETMEAGDG